MTNCSFCNDNVSMPYTCSLCSKKFCGKHRLAESHNCENIGVYSSPEYKTQKRQKAQEIQLVKGGHFSANSISKKASSRGSGVYSTWSHPNRYVTSFYGGVILSIAAVLSLLVTSRSNLSVISILDPIIMLLVGGILFTLVYEIRNQIANSEGVVSEFLIRPVGIAITLITALFQFTFLVFGNFSNDSSDLRKNSKIGVSTILSFAVTWLVIRTISKLVLTQISVGLALGLAFLGRYFLFYGLILMIPWSILDGFAIFNYNRRNYWLLLIFMIILYILSIVGN